MTDMLLRLSAIDHSHELYDHKLVNHEAHEQTRLQRL